MDILVLNKDKQAIGIVDTAESIIWVDRYNSFGDFELFTGFSPVFLDLFQQDYYLKIPDSEKTMIIESLEIKTDVEIGNKLVIRGRSLESILDRRIVLQQTIVDSLLQTVIEQLLNENMIDSSQPVRNIPNFVFLTSTDPLITGLTLKAQYDGENIYDVVEYLCKNENIGFKIIFNANNEFVFNLFAGQDRSYNQFENPFVIFSPNFDNLINSSYFESKKYRKTYSLVFGETHAWRVEAFIKGFSPGYFTGLDRREILTDASDLSKEYGTISDPDYHDQLKERGFETLGKNISFSLFEGKADTTIGFKYGTDFFLGDLVQIENEYGQTGVSRITEVTISEDLNGKNIYPTFEKI